MINIDLNKVPHIRIIIVTLIAFASIFPVFHFIYELRPDLYKRDDLFDILLLSFSIGFPIVFIYTAMAFTSVYFGFELTYHVMTYENAFYYSALIGSTLTSIGFYMPFLRPIFKDGKFKEYPEIINSLIWIHGGYAMFLFTIMIILMVTSLFVKPKNKPDENNRWWSKH